MSSAITNAGEALIALHQNRETGLIIDKFILANIPGVDPAAAVDRAEGKPAAENIVYEYAIPEEGKGYINPNQVVYSMLLGSDIGDFEFNWLGLYSSADDTVVAITYCPTLSKWKTAHPTMGNALTRNFMLEYSGLQATTQITVEASTWQIDFTTRQKGIDERERLSNRDIYGGACFFGDGYLIVNKEGSFTLQPGTGYVEGIRIDQVAEQDLAPALPVEVFLDVALQPQGSDRLAIAQIVYADPGDYTDGTNDTHYGQKIAEIDAGGVVTDCRPKTLGGELGGVVAKKDHDHQTRDIQDLLPAPHQWAEGQCYRQTTLAINAGVVNWDMESKPHTMLILTEDVTSFVIGNFKAGGTYELTIRQDAIGNRTCSWPVFVLWPEGTVLDVTADPNSEDIINFSVRDNDGSPVLRAFFGQNFKAVI